MAEEIVELNSGTPQSQDAGPLGKTLAEHLEKTVDGFKMGENENEQPKPGEEEPKPEGEPKPGEELQKKEGEDEEPKPGEEDKPEKEGEEEDPDKPKGEEDDKEPEPGKPVPYERFSEVVEARNSFKRQLDEVQPSVRNYQNITGFCQQHSITPDQFNKALEVQALLNTNPQEALKRLLPIMEQLQGFVGDKLPEDLQKKVDAGKLDLEDARETARLRAKVQHGEGMQKLTAQQQQVQEQQRFQQECAREAQTWETAKRASDPDYHPKKSENEVDGKWEEVRDKYLALLNQLDGQGKYVNLVDSPSAMTKLMERAYSIINEKWTKRNGAGTKPKLGRQLRSNGAPSNTPTRVEDAKTMKEAIEITLAQRR